MSEPTLREGAFHAVGGSSHRLKTEIVEALLKQWQGPIARHHEPEDLGTLILDLGSPSLFGEATLHLVRGADRFWQKHAKALEELVSQPLAMNALIALVDKPDRRSQPWKALDKAGRYHLAEGPDRKQIGPWVMERLRALPQGVSNPGETSAVILDRSGEDLDAILGLIEVAALHAGDGPLSSADVNAVCGSVAERPPWDFTAAVFKGDVKQSLVLFQSWRDPSPERAFSMLASDIRKRLACLESDDDAVVARLLGGKGGGSLYYARRDAKAIGRVKLQRLLVGILRAQAACRSNADPLWELESYIHNARKVLRAS